MVLRAVDMNGGGGGSSNVPSWARVNVPKINLPDFSAITRAAQQANQYAQQAQQIYRPYVPAYNPPPPPVNYGGWNGGGYNGGGGGGYSQPSTPVAPPPPPPPPKIDYSKFTDAQLAGEDSTLASQMSAFKSAIQRMMGDDKRQRTNLGGDRDTAISGIGRNQETGLTNLNEDFAARGLGRSGLLFQAQGDTRNAFDNQRTNVQNAYTKGIDSLDMKKRNFEAENGRIVGGKISGGTKVQAARADALARLAAKQNLT